MPSSKGAASVKSGSASTTASSGTKRRRRDEIKFYAVRAGYQPGVYHSWPDCLAQVKGFKNAQYKAFPTLTEAEAFVKAAPTPSMMSSASAPQKFYAVQSGRVPGVYTDWGDAQKQITGWTRPKHKSFPTRAEAEAFVAAGPNVGSAIPNVSVEPDEPPISTKKNGAPQAKKQKKAEPPAAPVAASSDEIEPGTGPLPPDAEDGFDNRVILNPETGKIEYKSKIQKATMKAHPTGNLKDPGRFMHIYTDGSSLGNQTQGAVAGVGVYFGPNDARNVSEPLPGPRQTNQRAELTAIQRALDIAPIDRPVEIFSDSNYAINCVTVWFQNWRKNGWVNSSKKPVENKDLVEIIVNKIEQREEHCKVGTKFTWIKGHANHPGNVAADHLAVNGARIAQSARSRSQS